MDELRNGSQGAPNLHPLPPVTPVQDTPKSLPSVQSPTTTADIREAVQMNQA